MKSFELREIIYKCIFPKPGPAQYSLREISRATKISTATISRFMHGEAIYNTAQDKLIDWASVALENIDLTKEERMAE